ncbi:phosphotransferase [Bacillus sp. NEAU-Y102]
MSNYDNEEKLTGGNVSNVYRSENTVRRELKPDSAKIHKLLQHLENKGFHYTPKFLGVDGEDREVLCHNDFAIYNIIFNNEKPVGIIDFDVAAPGPRLWDIAYTLYTCVPLSRVYYTESGEAIHYESSQHADRIKERVKLFVQSYGKNMDEDYLGMVLLRLEGLCTYMKRKAQEGDLNFQRMIDEGHLEHYEKDMKFIRNHRAEWR